MARLGALLVIEGLVAPAKVEQALRAQVVWGGRLGTNLIELGCIDLEELSRALGRLHDLPAALARHFERADPELQAQLPRELAERLSVVPLVRLGEERKVALVALDPLDDNALATLAETFGVEPDQLVVAVAAEMRIRYHLERVYQIPRDARFLRSKGPRVTPFPRFDNVQVPVDSEPEILVTIEADEPPQPKRPPPPPPPLPASTTVDDIEAMLEQAIAAATTPHEEPAGRDRRTYVRTLADEVEPAKEPLALGRIAIRRVALPAQAAGANEAALQPSSTLSEAMRAIRRSKNRERVAELVIDAVNRFAPDCSAAMLLVIRGEIATGWRWFSRSGATPPSLAVPLDQPGLAPSAIEHNATTRRAAGELGEIDLRLVRALGCADVDLAIVPIAIDGQVMCLIAAATAPDAAVGQVETIATAAGAAFARLIRDASS